MFTIGEFSRITGLSIKALRLYHEKGILEPTKVEEFTSYRYYDEVAIEKARVIQYLKRMEFKLGEIKEIVENFEDESEIVEFLENHKEIIEEKILQYKNISFSLETIIAKERESKIMLKNSEFEIEEKDVDTLLVASIRMKGKYSDCGPLFGKIAKKMGRHINGKSLNLYYDDEYKENDADFESCLPVRKGKEVDGISIRELKGGRSVTLIYKGPYEEIGTAYQKIIAYIKERGYKIVPPSREVYLKGPGMIFKGNPKNYLTEIQFMIEN
jgi:DNA-binding transcriptional MerR regulator